MPVQQAVQTDGVLHASPTLYEHLRLHQRVEDFTIQDFITQLAAGALDIITFHATYLGERWSAAGVTLENWLPNGDTFATEADLKNLRTAAEGAFASDPGNVPYGYWLNACRWEAEVARFPKVAPCLQPMPPAAPNYHIAGLTLQVSIPYLHESFFAEWKADYEKVKQEPWRLSVPLALEARPIGKLSVIGTTNGNEAIADLEQLSEYLSFLQEEIAQIVADPALAGFDAWQAPKVLTPSLN